MSNVNRQLNLPGFGDADESGVEAITLRDQGAREPLAPSSVSRHAVYVMDVHYLIFQVFHALPDIRSPGGQPVAAVYGFIQDLVGVFQRYRPDYLFCAFDTPLCENHRRLRYADYKANRTAMPDELQSQMATVRRILSAMAIPMLECAGFEADDVLATVASEAEHRDMDCFLLTGDKDCRQLISGRVKILNIRKHEVFDACSLERTWGIRPEQVVDFQALIGDPVDNLPGVALIGPQTASQLLGRFETLDNLLTHIDEVAGDKRRTNLKAARESVLLTRELAKLNRSVPINIEWDNWRLGKLDQSLIRPLCRDLGLHRLAERLASL